MCLSDTAEYWHDIKTAFDRRANKHTFTHIPNVDCGHYHVEESNNVSIIDCRACKKLLTPELISRLNNEYEKQIEAVNKEIFKLGKCECGGAMHKRQNKKTKEYFLGCSEYPKCKRTKQLTQSA